MFEARGREKEQLKAGIQGKSEEARVTGAAHCMDLEGTDLSEIPQLTSFSLVSEKQESSPSLLLIIEQSCVWEGSPQYPPCDGAMGTRSGRIRGPLHVLNHLSSHTNRSIWLPSPTCRPCGFIFFLNKLRNVPPTTWD